MKITWLGHSCFTVESQGYRIVLDPYKDGSVPGLAPVRVEADQVLAATAMATTAEPRAYPCVRAGRPRLRWRPSIPGMTTKRARCAAPTPSTS